LLFFGLLFPRINDDSRSNSHQGVISVCALYIAPWRWLHAMAETRCHCIPYMWVRGICCTVCSDTKLIYQRNF